MDVVVSKSEVEVAKQTLDAVYNSPSLKWADNMQFVAVKMDGCIVYTPCSHIPEHKQLSFRDSLQQVYELSKNKT